MFDWTENPVAQCIVETENHNGDQSYEHDYARGFLDHLAARRPRNLLSFFYNFPEEHNRIGDDVSRFFIVCCLTALRLLRGICVGALHLILVLGSRLFGHLFRDPHHILELFRLALLFRKDSRPEGVEPSTNILETFVLPLN